MPSEMTNPSRGDSPPTRGVAPSAFGAAWMYVTCPECGQRLKQPFARLAGLQTNSHRTPSGEASCRIVVVIDKDFGPARVVVVRRPASIEDVIARETQTHLAQRTAA